MSVVDRDGRRPGGVRGLDGRERSERHQPLGHDEPPCGVLGRPREERAIEGDTDQHQRCRSRRPPEDGLGLVAHDQVTGRESSHILVSVGEWGTGVMTPRHDAVRSGPHLHITTAQQWPEHSPAVAFMVPLPRMPEGNMEEAMAIDQVDRTVVTQQPTGAGQDTIRTDHRRLTTSRPGGAEFARRVVVLVFGLIQLLIAARIVLLLIGAREANALVSAILNASQLFVAPFEGILRTDSLHSAGSTLDITAIVALIGWTIVELIVLWAIGIFRREPASAQV